MASVEECRAALDRLGEHFHQIGPEDRAKHVVERTLSCHISDLGVTFYGRIHPDGLDPFRQTPPPNGAPAQVRLTVSSDDLVDLVDGKLDMAKALFSGRLKVDASLGDLLRLRRLL